MGLSSFYLFNSALRAFSHGVSPAGTPPSVHAPHPEAMEKFGKQKAKSPATPSPAESKRASHSRLVAALGLCLQETHRQPTEDDKNGGQHADVVIPVFGMGLVLGEQQPAIHTAHVTVTVTAQSQHSHSIRTGGYHPATPTQPDTRHQGSCPRGVRRTRTRTRTTEPRYRSGGRGKGEGGS